LTRVEIVANVILIAPICNAGRHDTVLSSQTAVSSALDQIMASRCEEIR